MKKSNKKSKSIKNEKNLIKEGLTSKNKNLKEKEKNNINLKDKDIRKNKEKQKNKDKKINLDTISLKRKAKLIALVCLVIVVIELIIMFIIHSLREDKITYIDTLYSINIVDDYYIAAGSSNFKHSRYNNTFVYQYQNQEDKKIQNIYAEKAKFTKYDNELNVIFESTFSSDYDSTFYDVVKVSDGYIAVGSYIYEKKQLDLRTSDGLIVKYDLNGKFVWSKNYQVLGDTEFRKILPLDDGFIVVGQSIYENMEIGNHPTGGGIIVKYDFSGELIWTNNHGGSKSAIFNDLIQVEDGYIACGKDASNYGMLVKFGLDGAKIWVKNYANTDTIGFSDIALKEDKLYIASSYNSSDKKTEEGDIIFEYDACIFVYDLNGDLINKMILKGNKDDRFNSLILLDDKIITVGYTNSSDIKLDNLNYKEDMSEGMIVEFDYEGKILNKKVYGGNKNDNLTSIIKAIPNTANLINQTNDYIIAGYSNSKRSLFRGNGKDYYSKVLRYSDKLELLIEK